MSDNCPWCPPPTAWGGSPEMFERLRKWHDKGHPQSQGQVIDLANTSLADSEDVTNPPNQALQQGKDTK